MTTINSNKMDKSKDVTTDLAENKCIRTNRTHSCEVMIDFRTCLCPPKQQPN